MSMYEPQHNIRWDPTISHDARREVIRDYANIYGPQYFVETGTNDGGTVLAVHGHFKHSWTIEVGWHIWERNKPLFADKPDITAVLGDSKQELQTILEMLDTPALFWLDGHFCGDARGDEDTPVASELVTILATGMPHIILVDDSRLFGRDQAYPTLEWVRNLATTQDIEYDFSLKDDIIRLTPTEGF